MIISCIGIALIALSIAVTILSVAVFRISRRLAKLEGTTKGQTQ
jgi:hypothetical protein